MNAIRVELGKTGDGDDVDIRIAFREFRAALSHCKETALGSARMPDGKAERSVPVLIAPTHRCTQ